MMWRLGSRVFVNSTATPTTSNLHLIGDDVRFHQLLGHLWRGGKQGVIFYIIGDGADEIRRSHWVDFDAPMSMPSYDPQENIYFGVNPSNMPESYREDGTMIPPEFVRNHVETTVAINCLFAEFDVETFGGKDEILTHLADLKREGIPESSVIIDVGDAYVCFWLLEQPLCITDDNSRMEAIEIQSRWVYLVNGKQDAKIINHLVRVPKTTIFAERTTANLATVEIQEFALERQYVLDDLIRKLPLIAPSNSQEYPWYYNIGAHCTIPGFSDPQYVRPTYGDIHNHHRIQKPPTDNKVFSAEPTGADAISTLFRCGYIFSMNECDDTVEVNAEPLSDHMRMLIRAQLRDHGFTHVEVAEDAYVAEACKNRYHPVKQYLENLTWDGGRHIEHLSDYFEDSHEPIVYDDGMRSTVFAAWLQRWMIGAVAKVYARGAIAGQNPMLVLDGPQGLGKSTFVRWLGFPLSKLAIEATIQPARPEHLPYLATKWIWEVTELGAVTSPAARETLKNFISQITVTFAVPHAQYTVTKPTLASFIGTINNEATFITDTADSRRFNLVTLTHIDWAFAEQVDTNQLWAEAYARYKNNEPWTLTPEEVKVRDNIHELYALEDVYASWILRYFDVDERMARTNAPEWRTTSQDVVSRLQSMGMSGDAIAIQRSVAKSLLRLGLRKDASSRPVAWCGIRRRFDV